MWFETLGPEDRTLLGNPPGKVNVDFPAELSLQKGKLPPWCPTEKYRVPQIGSGDAGQGRYFSIVCNLAKYPEKSDGQAYLARQLRMYLSDVKRYAEVRATAVALVNTNDPPHVLGPACNKVTEAEYAGNEYL